MESQVSQSTDRVKSSLIPDFCDVRVIFMVVLITEVLAIVLSLATPTSAIGFWDQLAFLSMLLQWIALLNSAVLCASRRWLNRLSTKNALVVTYSVMLAVSFLIGVGLNVLKTFLGLDDLTSPIGEYFLLRVMVMSAVIYALLLRYFYIQHLWRSNIHAQAQAEVQALKARIRPHFLFNSMNTIASLISFKPDSAEKAVEDLSDLFRASLQEKNMHTLEDEISLTRSYLDIEALRLGERLDIDWDVDDSLNDEEIPSLCLQPLAENAIYHGIEPLPSGGIISISATRDGDHLVLCVSNPISDSSSMPHKKGNQMALANIRQRLQLVYGERAEFTSNETKHSYSVKLSVPLERVL